MKTAIRCLLLTILCLASLNPSFAQVGLHTMIYQGRAIDLYDTRQLTSRADGVIDEMRLSPNGQYLACMTTSAEASGRVVILSTSVGRPTIVTPGANMDQIVHTGGEIGTCSDSQGFAWSPDSKSLAVLIVRILIDKPQIDPQSGEEIPGRQRTEQGLLLASAGGMKRTYFAFPREVEFPRSLFWSPDGSRLAAICSLRSAPREAADPLSAERPSEAGARPVKERAILIINRNSGYVRYAYRCPMDEVIVLKGWAESGKSLLFRSIRGPESSVVTVSADGRGVTGQGEGKDDRLVSRDGTYRVAIGPGVTVEEPATGRKTQIAKSPTSRFIRWAPSGCMLAYSQPEELTDETGKRKETLAQLWIGTPDGNKANCMLVAHNATSVPEWSADGTRIAYISEGAAYVAQLQSRDADAYEKLSAGLPISDQEMQVLVLSQAKQAGTAMLMYAQDWDGNLPDPNNAMSALYPYVKSDRIFRMPGGGDGIFHQILGGSINSISNPADTVIGFMDAGRGWVANIYADGHVKLTPRRSGTTDKEDHRLQTTDYSGEQGV